jgi:hypothetical protein
MQTREDLVELAQLASSKPVHRKNRWLLPSSRVWRKDTRCARHRWTMEDSRHWRTGQGRWMKAERSSCGKPADCGRGAGQGYDAG